MAESDQAKTLADLLDRLYHASVPPEHEAVILEAVRIVALALGLLARVLKLV